jgi:hypothetical protein
MASAPQANLPLFYKDLMPLNSRDHGKWKMRTIDRAMWAVGQHAVPITAEEFIPAHVHYPIVFSSGDDPVPLALMGLNEGINVYFNDEGQVSEDIYIPAYLRRYPFLLAKLEPNSDTMSLCFDPTCDAIGEFEDGNALFDGDQPTEHTQNLLKFCEGFEEAGARTQGLIDELKKHELLMDGEVAIQRADQPDQPYVYRGFQMVNQEKLRELRGDQLRKWNENGILALIYAHVFSLDLMRFIFSRQTMQGKGPGAAVPNAAAEPAPANA